mmetsp:Transcript_10675/g.39178  ORF Transcript_10675/g.39178 Transcript_10675/m.39178 type:complete len:379 (-) Transcript_10675:43-1179(-)
MATALDVIIDSGQFTCKAGHSNPEDIPPVITPTVVRKAAANGDEELSFPISRGEVVDWEGLESIWNYILYDQVGWIYGEEGNLLTTAPALTAKDAYEKLAQIAFESFNVAGLFLTEQPISALYSVNKLTGCSVSIGDGVIDVAPVIDGNVHSTCVRRVKLGGRDMTRHLSKTLCSRYADSALHLALEGDSCMCITNEAFKTVIDIKESCSKVARSAQAYLDIQEDKSEDFIEQVTHTLPDGKTISIGKEAYVAGESLFQPRALLGLEEESLPEAIQQSISWCPLDNRKQLLENVVLYGGGSAMPGLKERFVSEMQQVSPMSFKPGVVKSPEYMPSSAAKYSSWLGAAILGKFVFTQNQQMTKFDYDEFGPSLIHKKGC